MREILQRHPITAALAAVGVLLVLVIAAEIAWGLRSAPPGAAAAGATPAFTESKLLPPIASTSAEQTYPETGSRPLFSPTRRPAPQATSTSTIAKGQYVLQGVIIVGDQRVAMLREKAAPGRLYRVEKGRDVNGVKVSEIEPQRVTLQVGDDTEVITLAVQKGAAPGPGAAAAQSAAPAAASGPFFVPAAPAAAPPPPAAPAPATPAAPRMIGAPPAGTAEPAQGDGSSGFGPRPRNTGPSAQQGTAGTSQETQQMTAEELLARRRARRQGQSQ